MARQALNTADVKIDQKPRIENAADRGGNIVQADQDALKDKDYTERLAMGEDPVTILIQPGSDENAPNSYGCWVNGKGAEAFIGGEWKSITYIPVGFPIIIKRKYVEVLGRAKVDRVHTRHEGTDKAEPKNWVERNTSAVANFVVLEDANPRGVPWLAELQRRNF